MKKFILSILIIATPMTAFAGNWIWCSDQQCSSEISFSSIDACRAYKESKGGYCRPG